MAKLNIDGYNEFYIKELFRKALEAEFKDTGLIEALLIQVDIKSNGDKIVVNVPNSPGLEKIALSIGFNTVNSTDDYTDIVINPNINIVQGVASIYTDLYTPEGIEAIVRHSLLNYPTYVDTLVAVQDIVVNCTAKVKGNLTEFCTGKGTPLEKLMSGILADINISLIPFEIGNKKISVRDSKLSIDCMQLPRVTDFLEKHNIEHIVAENRIGVVHRLDCISGYRGLESLIEFLYINITLASLETNVKPLF